MKIGIFGATSEIAKDLIRSFSGNQHFQLTLFARREQAVTEWLSSIGLPNQFMVKSFDAFDHNQHFDALLNFVGVGNPAKATAMGASILDITFQYDTMVLEYLQKHPNSRYIFLSSGAAYGSSFNEPVNQNTSAIIPINHLQPQDWYGISKLHAECRHRALPQLAIVDIRVFNYFSHTQDMSARFLITDIVRAIRDKTVLITSEGYIKRDFLNPVDFYQLITKIIAAKPANAAVDCFTLEPLDKSGLLLAMQEQFGLKFEISNSVSLVNATGGKPFYYSMNRRAEEFGYRPSLTSLEGVSKEVESYLRMIERQ
jgi:nucleoside-diphosphate-sugar epimerase